ncbi:AraC family ligand binding domain-containing protein [Paenibacillus ginsengarvi]|uniref:AraC family transcriptional regulator n=1 Tax=Paenibacillus ginsengarvi TaxID=400777 RepID=A0A3B0ALK1_9BACL|nr:AraC family transcriptional regulator [Paenibacillus ginsengarvi]RKN61274.1 AraC family transcriptional regulator [Paenibacillus ginsengarvi]
MTSGKNVQEPDLLLLFRLTHTEYISGQPQWNMPRQFAEAYMLLVVEAGEGELVADGRRFSLTRGQLYLLPPSTLVEMASSGQSPLGLYLLQFQALRENGQTDKTVLFAKESDAAGFPYTGRLPEPLYAGALVAVEPLCRRSSDRTRPGIHQTYRLFHQVLAAICEPVHDRGRLDASEAIDKAVAYMNEFYRDPISREQLAVIAGISSWHFSHKFKETTGQSPTAMLESIRMRKASVSFYQSVRPLCR